MSSSRRFLFLLAVVCPLALSLPLFANAAPLRAANANPTWYVDSPVLYRAQAEPYDHYKLFIGGEWINSTGGETFASINPATEKVIADFQSGNEKDIDAAVTAARRATEHWGKTSVTERANILHNIANILSTRSMIFCHY